MVVSFLLHNSRGNRHNLCKNVHLYKYEPVPLFDAFGISSWNSNGIVLDYSNLRLYSLTMLVSGYLRLGRFSINLLCDIYSSDLQNCLVVRVRLRFVYILCTRYFSKDSNIDNYIPGLLDSWLNIFCQNMLFPYYILDKSCPYR